MPFADLVGEMAEVRMRSPLRVNEVFPDWKIGETYSGRIEFVLHEMDEGGSTLDVFKFEADGDPQTNLDEIEDRGPMESAMMSVRPSPS